MLCRSARHGLPAFAVFLIRALTLVVAGLLDEAAPIGAHSIRNEIANAKLVTLQTSHLSNIERPEECIRMRFSWRALTMVLKAVR
jgi:hypothetical protein